MHSIKFEMSQSQRKITNTLDKITNFFLSRIVLAVIFIAVASLVHNLLMIYVIEKLPGNYYVYMYALESVMMFFLFLYLYRLYVRFIECRPAVEVSKDYSFVETIYGFGIGGGLVLLMVLVLIISGYYNIEDYNSTTTLLSAFVTFGIGSLVQEIIVRLILFRILEDMIGSWYAMLITALIFGAIHLFNSNASLFTSLSITVSDILLIGSYLLTRRIWMVWGIHFGWNFFQDGIFGMPNSGETSLPSWINPTVSGPDWLSGGSFGIEASYLSLLLNVAVALLILRVVIGKNRIVLPYWRRIKAV